MKQNHLDWYRRDIESTCDTCKEKMLQTCKWSHGTSPSLGLALIGCCLNGGAGWLGVVLGLGLLLRLRGGSGGLGVPFLALSTLRLTLALCALLVVAWAHTTETAAVHRSRTAATSATTEVPTEITATFIILNLRAMELNHSGEK